jgi:quercetin dioxygenase-like cupin family protein
MSHRVHRLFLLLSIGLTVSVSAQGQEMAGGSSGRNVSEMKFTTIPPLPTCATGSVQSGDPANGTSVILAKMKTGCVVPWHWHTPNEHVMLVSGVGRMEMKGGKTLTMRAGAFALMASKQIHQFTCVRSCQLYVHSDAAFDIHYTNANGDEITPAEAMKAVKQTAATETK